LRLCTSLHRISFNANNKPCREWQGMEATVNTTQISSAAIASRDCAKTLMKLSREWRDMGDTAEATRLVKKARWFWHWYLRAPALTDEAVQ
jgi:prephenate dehydratase